METGGREFSTKLRRILSAAGFLLILGAVYSALFIDVLPFLWFVLFSGGSLCAALAVEPDGAK